MSLSNWIAPRPRDPPRRYPQAEPDEVMALVASTDDAVSSELLAEAQWVFAEPDDRISSVDRRAGTLQGSVAIAATVALTGGGIILDRGKVPDAGWRLAFAIGLGVLLIFLLLSGLRAASASARIFVQRAPADTSLMQRASQDDVVLYRRQRAAYLLWAYGRNSEVAAVKVEYLRKAAFWFRLALVALVVIMALLVSFVLFYDFPPTPPA